LGREGRCKSYVKYNGVILSLIKTTWCCKYKRKENNVYMKRKNRKREKERKIQKENKLSRSKCISCEHQGFVIIGREDCGL
jgi:hypothetical protein